MIKKIVLLLVLSVLVSSTGCGRDVDASAKVTGKQPTPISSLGQQNQLVQRSRGLFDAARIAGKAIVAVGKKGEILRSDDGGKLWSQVASGTSKPLFSVAFSDDKHGAIVGFKGRYLESSDGGRNWTRRSVGIDENLFSIRFFEHRIGFIVGAFGTLMKSDDAGKRWRAINLKWDKLLPKLTQQLGVVQPHLYGIVFCDSQHGWIVGEYGLILGTEDGGKTWHRQAGGGVADRQLFAVATMGLGKVVAAGQGGEILYTADYGQHWVPSFPADGRDIYGLVPLGPKGELLALGDLGNALVSTGAGTPNSWHAVNLARGATTQLSDTWLAAAVSEPDDVLAFGQLGIWSLKLDSVADSPS